jgi:hypothetical protein
MREVTAALEELSSLGCPLDQRGPASPGSDEDRDRRAGLLVPNVGVPCYKHSGCAAVRCVRAWRIEVTTGGRVRVVFETSPQWEIMSS